MTTGTPTVVWQNLRRWLPGVVISGVALWLVLRTVSWQSVGEALGEMRLSSLALALLFFILSMLARVTCWYTLLQHKAPLKRAFFVLNEGYMLNNIFPFRLGEIGRAVLLGSGSAIGFFPVLSTIIVERSYDLAVASSLLLTTLPLALAMDWARPLALAILAAVVLGLAALVGMARYRAQVMARLNRLPIHWRFYQNWVLTKFDSILEGFSVLTRPSFFVLSLGLMLVSWGLAILEEWVLLRNVSPGAPIWWVCFSLGAAAIGAGLPSVAGAIGVFEAAIVGTLLLVGVPKEDGLAFAFVVHAMQFVMTTSLGVIGLILEGENLGNLYRRLISRKS